MLVLKLLIRGFLYDDLYPLVTLKVVEIVFSLAEFLSRDTRIQIKVLT